MRELAGAMIKQWLFFSRFLCCGVIILGLTDSHAVTLRSKKQYGDIIQPQPVVIAPVAIQPHQAAPVQQAAINPANLQYERASTRDIAELLTLIENFTDDDKFKLVVFPPEVQRNIISKTIRMGRLWIARNPATKAIVSYLKLYIIDDQDELQDILQHELRCVRTDTRKTSLAAAGRYSMSLGVVYKFDERPAFVPARLRYTWNEKQSYVYYGSAYTLPAYRGKGVSTALERYALEQIKSDIVQAIIKNKSTKLFYVYGVVEDNSESLGRVRVLSEFAHRYIKPRLGIADPTQDDYYNQATSLLFNQFHSYKPTFVMNGKHCVSLDDDDPFALDGAGYGCLICLDLK